jgi:hypothetical protein
MRLAVRWVSAPYGGFGEGSALLSEKFGGRWRMKGTYVQAESGVDLRVR